MIENRLGLTLIETLVALSIVSVALIALMTANIRGVRALETLKTKTLALYAAEELLNEIKLNLDAHTASPCVLALRDGRAGLLDAQTVSACQTKAMLRRTFTANITREKTNAPMITRIRVCIAEAGHAPMLCEQIYQLRQGREA